MSAALTKHEGISETSPEIDTVKMSAVLRKHEGNPENNWFLASTQKPPKTLSLASCFHEKSRSALGSWAWPNLDLDDPRGARCSPPASPEPPSAPVLTPCVARSPVSAVALPSNVFCFSTFFFHGFSQLKQKTLKRMSTNHFFREFSSDRFFR